MASLEFLESLEPRRLLSAISVDLDANKRVQTIDGFGTSLAWWTPNLYGTPAWRDTYFKDLGSSMLRVDLNILALPGSDGDVRTPVAMGEDLQANIDQFDWNSLPTTQFGGVVHAAVSRKVDDFKVMGTIWTPPQWMKGPQVDPVTGAVNNKVDVVSGEPMPVVRSVGGFENSIGGSLIDTPENLQQFGRYVAAYVKGYEQHFGVPMEAVSIQNELEFDQVSPSRPNDPFNGFNSCVYTPALLVKAIKAVGGAFHHYGITTKIMAPEALAADEMRYINAIRADPEAAADVGLYDIHGSVPTAFAAATRADAKKGWMTETSGEAATWDGAMNLARNAQNALVQGNVSAWLYWQTSEGASQTSTSLTAGAQTTAPKYAAAKQFFRYIRPGAVRISATPTDAAGVYASAFVQDQQHTLTTVLLNSGTSAQTLNLHLAGGVHANLFSVARESTANAPWQDLGPIALGGDSATFTLPAKSILTLVGQTITQSPAQSPFHGTPFSVGATAPVTIQAEDFDLGGEGLAYHDREKANLGGAYRTSEGVDLQPTSDASGRYNVAYAKAGEWLEYTIDVASAGKYTFDFRLAAVSAGGKFHAEIDGANVTGSLAVPNTGGWQTWNTLSKTGVALSSGQHVLRIALEANGSSGSVGNFNYVTIRPDGPLPPPSTLITIQAEDFNAGAEGVAYHDLDAANLGGKYRSSGVDIQSTTDPGGGYNLAFVKAGEWLKYTADVATAGSYAIDFRVASAGSNGRFHLEIDGLDVTGSMTIPNTGGWQNWTTLSASDIQLTAGSHALGLRMDANGSTGSVGNFNWLRLTPT